MSNKRVHTERLRTLSIGCDTKILPSGEAQAVMEDKKPLILRAKQIADSI
jgi:hypothetical protein